ncbi:MAG: sulfur carrier protein ThiS [Nitrospirae bacterium]|nr:sulfur carrier protein ThiS [Nitrospirota bacterium]
MKIRLNGEERVISDGMTIDALLSTLNVSELSSAVELNLNILDKKDYGKTRLNDGDLVEIISFVGGGAMTDTLTIANIEFGSRLWVGTGKYKDFMETKRAIEASGADVVTVAVRRVNIVDRDKEGLLDYIDPKKYKILPNTAGCYTTEDAIRTAYLARAAGISNMVKLEVIGDERTLFPDNEALLEAARILVGEGFIVFPYTNDDPVMARKLEDAGCAAVMPLAAPIGSGLGIRNPYNIKIILETISIPVIVDAGVGTASDAAIAMELGCDGVLMNTAIAGAKDPIAMAEAMRYAVLAGRLAYRAGRIPKKLYATASSPMEGTLT